MVYRIYAPCAGAFVTSKALFRGVFKPELESSPPGVHLSHADDVIGIAPPFPRHCCAVRLSTNQYHAMCSSFQAVHQYFRSNIPLICIS